MKRIMQIAAILVFVSATNGYGWEWPWNWGQSPKDNINVNEYYYRSGSSKPVGYSSEIAYRNPPTSMVFETVQYPRERTWLEKMRYRYAQYRKQQPKEAIVTGQRTVTPEVERTTITPVYFNEMAGTTYQILPSGEKVLIGTNPASSGQYLKIRKEVTMPGVSKPIYTNPRAFSKEAQQQYQWAKDRE